ncbi:MAG TPA: glycosyltransferase family 2 protein [Nitrospira sp.]|nr:glycosyltransferase family 2 protein [Nitrospira sp.]
MEPFSTAHVAFFASLALLAYSYVGYPAVLWILNRLAGDERATPEDPAVWPDVSVVIAAHNEELVIGRRIENLLALDYPRERLQIVIGSDGSTDRTSEIVRLYGRPRIAFHDFALQRGKAQVLNDLVGFARGKFIVFTDANTFFEPNAVKELIRGFRQVPGACAVVGRLELHTAEGTVNPDSFYWRYETLLKRLESRLGTVLGANGPIYAIKRVWYHPLPPGTIVDDFLIPMLIRMERGGAVIFRSTAKAWEMVPETVRDEFRRRVRIGAGDAHALRHTWRLLLPGHGMLAVSYWSHKALRWLGPALLLTVFLANLWLMDQAWGRAALFAQVGLYGLGCASSWLRTVPLVGKLATGIWYFMVINAALLLGTLKYVTGRAAPVWQRTSRTAELMHRIRTRPTRVKAAARSQKDSPAA